MSQAKTKIKPAPEEEEETHQTPPPPALVSDNQLIAAFAEEGDEFDGAGTSDRPEDNVTPFLSLLQKGSPQVNERDPAYIKGAKPGMLINTSTLRLYDVEQTATDEMRGLRALQVHVDRKWVEWIPRSAGGGFVGQHPYDSPIKQEAREVPSATDPDRTQLMLPNGHQLVDTAYHYLILLPELTPVVVGLSSTGLQTHRTWNAMYRNKIRRTPGGIKVEPSFRTMIRLTTYWRKNDSGDWFSLRVHDDGFLSSLPADVVSTLNIGDAYDLAKILFKSFKSGEMRVAEPPSPSDAAPTTSTPGRADEPHFDDDHPL